MKEGTGNLDTDRSPREIKIKGWGPLSAWADKLWWAMEQSEKTRGGGC